MRIICPIAAKSRRESKSKRLASIKDARYLDIVHLLSPLAREFLNLYASTPATTPTPRCYWTALNIDAAQPDSRLTLLANHYGTQSALAWEKLQADYEAVATPGALGDIVAYRETSGRRELLHVAAFVADDITFTKNGLGLMAPWCLMRLADLDALYLDGDRVERLHFRRQHVGSTRRRIQRQGGPPDTDADQGINSR